MLYLVRLGMPELHCGGCGCGRGHGRACRRHVHNYVPHAAHLQTHKNVSRGPNTQPTCRLTLSLHRLGAPSATTRGWWPATWPWWCRHPCPACEHACTTLSYTLTHEHAHTHTRTHTRTCAHTHTHAQSHTRTHTHAHTSFVRHTHTGTRTRTLRHTHTHTRVHTHTVHTHMPPFHIRSYVWTTCCHLWCSHPLMSHESSSPR